MTASPPPRSPRSREPSDTRATLVRWGSGTLALLILSFVIVRIAGTRPGYDPYGWLVWGKLTLHWKLDTNGAPSWKPLPYLFTVPYALFGHLALWLWMTTAVAVSLAGSVFAWRIAFRLTAERGAPAYASYAAATFAALAVLGIRDYAHYILSVQSDPMIVSMCLAAIDCQLSRRFRWGFWMWVLAALGRPEAWPFLGLYAIWCWREVPALRRMMVPGLLLVPLLWFGIPALTAKTWFVAGDNALNSPRALHQSKIYGTIDRFFDLQETTIWLAALLAVVVGALRRNRTIVLMGAGSLAWLVIEIAFVLHGWPGVPRYLFEPVGVASVLAGVFVGQVLAELPGWVRRVSERAAPRGLPAAAGGAAAAVVLALVLVPLLPAARSRADIERRDLTAQHARTTEIDRLYTVVQRLGAARLLGCAKINIPIGYQSILAWYLDIKIGELYVNVGDEAVHPTPLLNMYPIHGGWKVFPSHLTAADAIRCQGLTLVYQT